MFGSFIIAATLACGIGAAGVPEDEIRVTGWVLTESDFANSFGSFEKHADRVSEISPFWFYPLPDGNVTSMEPGPGNKDAKRLVDAEPLIRSICAAKGIKLIPTFGGAPPPYGDAVHRIITSPRLRTEHVRNLVLLARQRGYDGLDIDYESLAATDRNAYSAFMTELGVAMHAEGKILSMALHAKVSEPGDWDGPQAQDWAVIGRAVDRFRIMVYDFHEDSSEPGAIAPLDWFRQVLALAVKLVPREKIEIGIPTYGYDWQLDDGAEDMPQRYAPVLAARMSATIGYEPEQAASHFKYEAEGSPHEVWYEDARALPAKLKLIHAAGVRSISIWRFGEEAEEFWQQAGAVRPAPGPGPQKP